MKRSFANKTLIVFSLIAMIAILVIVGFKFSNKIAPETKEVDGQKIMDIVLDLTDETQFPHRNVSLPGNHDAALYIADAFEAYGLVSHEDTPNYLQYYDGKKANVIGIIPGSDEEIGRASWRERV